MVRSHGLVSPADLAPSCAASGPAAELQCFYEAFVRTKVLLPLGMDDSGFLPDPSAWPRCSPTAVPSGENASTVLQGRVNDGNAYMLGGISGHAGLFATGPDLAKFMDMCGLGVGVGVGHAGMLAHGLGAGTCLTRARPAPALCCSPAPRRSLPASTTTRRARARWGGTPTTPPSLTRVRSLRPPLPAPPTRPAASLMDGNRVVSQDGAVRAATCRPAPTCTSATRAP